MSFIQYPLMISTESVNLDKIKWKNLINFELINLINFRYGRINLITFNR